MDNFQIVEEKHADSITPTKNVDHYTVQSVKTTVQPVDLRILRVVVVDFMHFCVILEVYRNKTASTSTNQPKRNPTMFKTFNEIAKTQDVAALRARIQNGEL